MSDYHFGFCEKCGGSMMVDSNADFNDHADCTGCGETNAVRDMFPIWPPDPTAARLGRGTQEVAMKPDRLEAMRYLITEALSATKSGEGEDK